MNEKGKLTARQNDVFGCLLDLIRVKRRIPTYAELSERLGIFPNAVRDHMLAIEKKGWVERIPDIARGIIVKSD